MIDNYSLIDPLLTFENPDTFYFCQIIRRRKDNNDLKYDNRLIKSYYLCNCDSLSSNWEEMKEIANLFQARVMININHRSLKKTALYTMEIISSQLSCDNYHGVRSAYNSACGRPSGDDKSWIIDIDSRDYNVVKGVIDIVNEIRRDPKGIIKVIPSKSGYHVLTLPFNMKIFSHITDNKFDVHKNNPTNLYIP